VALTGLAMPSLALRVMLATPAALAVKVAAAMALLMAAAVPASWMPARLGLVSVRPLMTPFVALNVRLRLVVPCSASATVKLASAAGLPTVMA